MLDGDWGIRISDPKFRINNIIDPVNSVNPVNPVDRERTKETIFPSDPRPRPKGASLLPSLVFPLVGPLRASICIHIHLSCSPLVPDSLSPCHVGLAFRSGGRRDYMSLGAFFSCSFSLQILSGGEKRDWKGRQFWDDPAQEWK